MTTPPLAQFPGQQAQAARDVNTASLCRIGQETVQDIVLRTMEIFQLLRNMQVHSSPQRHPSTVSVLFTPLHLNHCGNFILSFVFQQLIPYVEDDSSKPDDRMANQMRAASEERREVLEVNKKLKQKNQQLKMIMDQLRNLIWEINSMLVVRS
uniref:Mediator of RNA polymerase II transcription subunit 30 n=1 Tax=Sinocyclocheilus grahami TaxID=75366 RepID=A0A672RLT6_SINGR